MKRKLFFITFLMLFCSSMFGQHWTMTEADEVLYNSNMTVTTVIEINGEEQRRTDLEIAAFCNNGLRGVGEIQYKESTDRYIATITILGGNVSGETINFKLFDPELDNGKELNTTFTVNFVTDEVIGKPSNPISINFNNTYWSIDISNLPITSMQYTSYIKIDGEEQRRTDLELAAFSGETLCGWVQPIYSSKADKFVAFLTIYGEQGDEITLKLYDPELEGGKVLTADSPFDFLNNNMVGNPTTPLEFKNNPVARIGEEGNAARYFSSLEAAVDAAQPGETVVLLQDVNLTETLTIEKSVTIDLNKKKVTLSTGGNMIESNVTIKNGNIAIADVDTKTTDNSNCFISTNVGASLTLDKIVMTGDGYTTHWAVLCAMSNSTTGSTINITNSTITLSNEKGDQGGFIKDQSGVDNYSKVNISNSTLTLNDVSRGFTGAKVTLDDVDLTITGGEHGINGSELVISNGSNVSISNGTGRAITLNKFDASIAGSNVTISNMGEGGIRYKTANTLTVDANSKLSETTAHADVDNAKLNDKVVRGKENQMSTVKVENGVTTVINPVAGQVAYRAYIEDSENREAVKVDLQNVNALQSLVVKLYDANNNLLTTTTYRAGAVEVPDYLTCNIVLRGTASSSWETVISAEKLTVDNYPYKAELVIDGSVINTFENILGNATDAAAYQLPAYKALGCVYKAASITKESKTEYYGTLAAAVNAAQDGDEIVLLDNVTDVDATISKKITLNLNEKIINDAYIIVKSEVNIKNGSIKNVNESYPLVVQDGGKLTVDAVNIEASKSDRAIWVRSGSSLVFNSGSILATKGEYNTKTNLIAAIYTDTNTDVTINGGTITVDTPDNKAIGIFGNYTNADVTVNGGKISTSGKNYSYAINVDGDITVTGGEIVTNEKGYGYSSGIRYGNNYALVSATGDVTITGGNITTNGYSGYIVNVGRTYSSNDQTVSITGGTFVNNLSGVEMTTGGHKAPVFIWEGSASKVTATITDGDFTGFSADFLREANAETTLAISGGTFDSEINEEYIAPGFKLEQNTDGTYGVVVDPAYGKVAKIGDTYYEKLADAFADVQEGQTIELLPVTIEQGTVKLPATLKNVTVKGVEGAVLKDMTIVAHDGNSINYEGITFDGIVFENSRISVTGWRNNGVVVKDFTVTNCRFYDLHDETSVAPVHFNMAATEPVNGFTFTNNVIDGATGGSKSGVYAQMTGKVIFTNNTINNVAFRPYVIQLTTNDGIADEFTVTGNTFSGSAAGRAQALTNNAEGTDAVTLTVSNNIFKGITEAQQICYWKFNEATTTATLEKNYYDIDVMANPGGIYYNSSAKNISDLSEMGIFPIYKELKEDGTINEESLFDPVAYVDTDAYETLAEAFAGQEGTIVLLKNIELTEGVVVAADKTFTLDLNGKTITGAPTEAAVFAVIKNSGNLTITDNTEAKEGKILCNHNLAPSTGYAVNTITNSGTLTIEAGTIENKSTYPSSNQIGYAIDNNSTTGNAVVTIKGGNVTVSGSTYYDGIRQFCNSTTLENSVTIEGGEVSTLWIQNPSNDNEKDVKGSFAITGGTLNNLYLEPSANFSGSISGGHIDRIARYESGDNDIVSFITGGTFGMDVTEFCAFNYVCTSNGDGTYGIEYKPQEEDAFVIETLHELEAFRDAVNAGNNFSGKVFKLKSNIDLNPTRAINIWEPIGTQANPFKGTFDGGDNTISNLVVVGENNVGLFGYADNATIKNIKLENVNVKGTDCVGAIAGQVYSTSLIDNCHVSGSIQVEGQTNVGGIVGKYYTKVKNCSVIGDGVATSYVKGTYKASDFEGDNIGGIMGHGGEDNRFENNTVKNITISGTRKVAGIVGVTDMNTQVKNCVVENVNIETTATTEYANSKKNTMSNGTLVGSYTTGNNTTGTVESCVVKNVNFLNPNNAVVSVGPITGGLRGGTDGMLAPTGVTASNNNIYMSTITGSNNLYLMNAVAKIGETKYYTLQEAVAASETNETTIDVIANTAETINVQEGANITINNINLTGSILAPNATLKIVNGSIVNNNSNVSAIEINAGTLNLEGVNISSARHAVRIDGNVIAEVNGGKYTLIPSNGVTQHAFNISDNANVTINGGKFVGPAGTASDSGSAVNVKSGATVTINGGEFSGGKNHTLSAAGILIVKGGTFDQDPSAYLADAYTVNIENEMYVVRYTPIMVTYPVGNPVYPEGKVEYYSDMLEAVPYTTNCPRLEGATITLLADVSGAGMRFMENDMVFDLNGHTYTITDGTGSQGTNTSGFQIRPEVTTNVLFKDGTIKVAEGAPVVWMFNCYATDFIVEDVTVDCSNMAYSYGDKVYVVVSREGDNVQLTGETKIVNFNSNVAGNAINVGDTMTIGEDVDLGGGTIELDGGAQLTAPADLNVVTVDGYMVVYENGVYKSVKVVAQVGNVKYESVAAAMTAAKEAGVKDLEITIIGENTQDTDDSFNLSYATAFDNVTIKQDNDNKPFYIKSIYTGDRTSTDGKFVFDGVNMIITKQIWFECDVVLTNNSSVKRSNDVKNFIYYGEVTVEPGSKYISQIDDVMAGSFTVDGGKTDGTYNEAEDFKTVFFDVRYGQTFTAKNGANILISSGEGGKLSLMGNANIDASKVYVYNEIALGDNGQFAIDIESSVTTNNVTGKGVISVDALNINEGVVYNVITANMSSFAGIIEINNDDAEYEITSTGLVVKMKPFVAEVDGTQFTSLQRAFDAVQDNDTITLLRDVTFDLTTVGYQDENWVDGVRYNGDKSFTVNFNTYKVTDNGCVNDYLININNKGEKDNEITFTNGTIESANGCWATVCVGAESSTHKTVLNLNDMNIINENDASYSGNLAVRVRGTADVNTTVNVNNGTTITSDGASYGIAPSTNGAVVNINSGAIIEQKNSGTSGGNSVFAAVGGKGTVNIYDGAIIRSDSYGVHTMTTGTPVVNIYGGTITAVVALKASTNGGDGQSSTINVSGGMITGALEEYTDNAQIILTGGTFSTDVNAYCHEYYDAVTEDNITWTVEQVLFAQTTELQAGWNWYSSYINLAKDNGLSKLQNAIVQNYENGVGNALIKGQTNNQSVQYDYIGTLEGVDYYDWTGNTFAPVANKMYMIYTSKAIASEDFMIEGEKVDYENTTIALFQGWNWISYPLDEPTLINEALKNFTGATTGDQIKWYGTQFVTYMNGKWYPENFTMMPGEGYMYKAAKQGSFMYSKGTGNNKSDANANMTVENSHWTPEISQYANNMTITAMLSVDDEIVKGDYEIAAFANGECRGSARPIYVEELDAYVLLMAVFGEDVEELTFKYYDVNYDTEYELSNRINYSNDAVVGSIDEPYMFNLDILNIGETSVENISIYPNPTTTGSEINLQTVCDKVEVFNALGVKIAEYSNVDSIDAIETAGVYVIRLTIDNSARNCRLIVK